MSSGAPRIRQDDPLQDFMNDVVKSARRVIRDVNRREKEDDRRKYMEEMKVASRKQKRAKINKGSKIIETSSSNGCADGKGDDGDDDEHAGAGGTFRHSH